MKNWFVISIAVMSFLVACGKKSKLQGQIGKTVNGSGLDCKVKDKDKDACKPEAKAGNTPKADDSAAKNVPTETSGTDEKAQTLETFPNLKEANIMSLHLDENYGITAEFSLSATEADDKYTPIQISCADVKDLSKATLTEKILNPDKLEEVEGKIYLLNKSQMLAKMKISKGDGAGEKPYMISCKNSSTVTASEFEKSESYQVKKLDLGSSALELISLSKNADEGVLTSVQCVSNDDFVKDYAESKKVSADNYILNRIKLTSGSSVLLTRAINQKFDDKKLSELDTKLKDQKYVIVTCK